MAAICEELVPTTGIYHRLKHLGRRLISNQNTACKLSSHIRPAIVGNFSILQIMKRYQTAANKLELHLLVHYIY